MAQPTAGQASPISPISSATVQPSQPGLSLSPAMAPFPRRLVNRVLAGQFIDMRELLADNMALVQQLESVPGSSMLGTSRPRLREVTSLPTWCYCFLGYMAIRTSDPSTRDQLSYARLMIREARRHGGTGWLDYDRAFRQQAAVDPSQRWNTLVPGLQASTILGQRAMPGSFCTLCREVDHTRAQCALLCLEPPSAQSVRPPRPNVPRRPDAGLNVCISWNRGRCIFPGQCTYRHVCATCQLPHRAKDCTQTPDTSIYRQRPGQNQRLPTSLPTSRQ